jgi:phosphohistidine phosphatase SixA
MTCVRALVPVLVVLIVPVPEVVAASAHQVIFVVRHAERAATNDPTASKRMMADDPPLTPAGQARAARLATMLASAGIQRIYTTEFQRSRQTAAPLAEKLKITPVMAAANDPAPLLQQLQRSTGNVLVVGQSNTIPDVLKKLGVKDTVTLADDQYDDLFIVIRRVGEPSTLIRLKY